MYCEDTKLEQRISGLPLDFIIKNGNTSLSMKIKLHVSEQNTIIAGVICFTGDKER